MKELVDSQGKDGLVAILDVADAESVALYAETLVNGDPSWLGPLAGVSLGLPVYHVAEPEIKRQVDPACYGQHIAPLETVVDLRRITDRLESIRGHG